MCAVCFAEDNVSRGSSLDSLADNEGDYAGCVRTPDAGECRVETASIVFFALCAYANRQLCEPTGRIPLHVPKFALCSLLLSLKMNFWGEFYSYTPQLLMEKIGYF